MPTTAPAPDAAQADLGDCGLLASLREHRQVIAVAEVEELDLVHAWALAHPACGDSSVLTSDEQPGGSGTPGVAAFTAEPLGVALGISSAAAQSLLADTLDLQHRLPRLLDQVRALRLPVWRARRIARATRDLSEAAAHWVDRQLIGCAASVGTAQLDRLVQTAVARVDPQGQAEREEAARETWDVTLTHPADWAGTSTLTAVGDTADLTGLHALVVAEAEALAPVSDRTAGQRRVLALSTLVRRGAQDALDLGGSGGDEGARDEAASMTASHVGSGHRARSDRVRLYVHASLAELLSGTADDGSIREGSGAVGEAVGTVERLGPLTLARLREWVGHSRVTVVPVLDLADAPWVPRHDPPPRMAEQVVLRDTGCVFPRCGRDARACDLDHVDPWRAPPPPPPTASPATSPPPTGATTPDNLAPLCRRHHRLKTAGTWTYERVDDAFLWRGPHGQLVYVRHSSAVTVT